MSDLTEIKVTTSDITTINIGANDITNVTVANADSTIITSVPVSISVPLSVQPSFTFDINANVGSVNPGQFAWDSKYGTAKIGLTGGNVTLQVGQEFLAYVINAEATPIVDGEVVYLYGYDDTYNLAAVKRADNSNAATSETVIGMATETIQPGYPGFITQRGVVHDIDLTGIDGGEFLWLNSTGGFTKIEPEAPNHKVFIGIALKHPGNNMGSIFVLINPGAEIGNLHDVHIDSLTSGQTLKYITNRWENYTPSGPTQIFTVPGTLTTGIGKGRFYAPVNMTISNIRGYVATAPTGTDIIFDINKNGTTIFTNQATRPRIVENSNITSVNTPQIIALSAGDYLSVDMDQVGSSTPGADMTIQIEFAY